MADPTGIIINIALQAAIRLAIAALTPKENTEGPRLDDTTFTTSTYSNPIPIAYGTALLSGNVIWGRDIREEAVVTDIGKGNPFSLGTNTVYQYYATFAVAIAEREAAALIRIYADGKLIYATDSADVIEDMDGLTYRFYTGSERQNPDPIISEDYAAGEVPGYRGICYIVFNDLPLEHFGNRIPQFQFVVSFNETDGPQRATPMRMQGYSNNRVSDENEFVYDRRRNVVFAAGLTQSGGTYNISAAHADTGELLASMPYATINAELIAKRVRGGSGSSGEVLDYGIMPNGYPRVFVGGDSPYLVWVQNGAGVETHVVIDKATLLPFESTSNNGLGVGWIRYGVGANPTGQQGANPQITLTGGTQPQLRHADSSGGGVVFAVGNGLEEAWYYIGVSNGDTSAKLWDASRTDDDGNLDQLFDIGRKRGTYGIAKLPSIRNNLTGNHKLLGGSFGIYGVCEGRRGNGFTDLYLLSAIEDATDPNFSIYRLRFSNGGIETAAQTHDTPGSSSNTFLSEHRVQQGTHHMRYDAETDTLAIYVYDDNGAGSTGDRALLVYDCNTADVAGTSAEGTLNYIWGRGDLGYDPRAIPIDSQTNDSPDGTLLLRTATSPATYEIIAQDTGEVLEEVVMPSNTWVTPDGDELSGGNGAVWDGPRNRYFKYSLFGVNFGWFYIKPNQSRGTETLQTVVEDIVLRSELGASDIDASALSTKEVRGYATLQDMTYRAALQPLATAYNFYAVEKDGTLVFDFKGDTVDLTVTSDDMVAAQGTGRTFFEEIRIQDAELPAALYVGYMSAEADYLDDKSTQTARRSINPNKTMNSVGKVRIELPLTLTDEEAAEIVVRLLYESWVQQEKVKFQLSSESLIALPNDVMRFTANGRTDDIRLEQVSISATLEVEVEGSVLDGGVYTLNVVPAEAVGSPNWGKNDVIGSTPASAFGFLLDGPLLQDSYQSANGQALMMFAASAAATDTGTFRSAALGVAAQTTELVWRAETNTEMHWGAVTGGVPAHPGPDWNGVQEESLDVIVYNGLSSFTSVTQAQMIGEDANTAILFCPSLNSIEYIGFRDAEEVAFDGTTKIRLTGLIRGKRGSYDPSGNGFTGLTYLIIANSNWIAGYEEDISFNNLRVQYVVAAANQPISLSIATDVTYRHRALRPYAICHPTIVEEPSDGWTVSWTRRTRILGAWRDNYGDVGLGEDSESYQVEVVGVLGAVVRTFTVTEPEFEYTIANRDSDYPSGTDTLTVIISQVSASIGAGFERTVSFSLE